MPTITTEETVKIELEFEVYCNTCGAGLCGETTVKGHTYPQVKVNVCPDCMKDKDEEIKGLQEEIKQLEKIIDDLKYEIDNLKVKLED
jgi:hypothetical protein